MEHFQVLHVCDYAALYRGNFIDSLESLETYHNNIENLYLFPARARGTAAEEWINDLNRNGAKAYMQTNNILKNFVLLSKILKKHKINRIVRHFSDSKTDILIKLLFNSKHVIRFFHCDCLPIKNPVKRWLMNFAWRNNKLVGVSDAVTAQIRAVYPKFSAFSIPNAIHFERLDKHEKFEKAKGISLLMMGWSYQIKGVDLAIKAVCPLQKKYNLTLQIVGGRNENKIKELAKDILGEDADWIRYLPPTNHVGTYYAANDIFLGPSRQEAFGYSNIEAAYCENSIVLSKVGGQSQLKIEGAYWIEPENIGDFTQKLETAILELNSPAKIAQRKSAKEQVEKIYSLQEWSNKLVALF